MIMALGVFGMMSVVAEDLDDDVLIEEIIEEPAEEPEDDEDPPASAQAPAAAPVDEDADVQAAQTGFNPAHQLTLEENRVHSKGSGTAEVKWNAFLADTSVSPTYPSFYTQYVAAPRTADFKWYVQRWNATAAMAAYNALPANGRPTLESFMQEQRDNDALWEKLSNGDPFYRTVADNLLLANASSGIYPVVSATAVTLTVGQPTINKWYGWVRVKLSITVGGIPSAPASEVWRAVELVDSSEFAKLINKLKEEYAKSDRYTDNYRNNLKALYEAAEGLMQTTKLSQEDINLYTLYMNRGLAGQNALGESIGNIWKLSGIDFIDNLLGQGFIAFIWRVVDIGTVIWNMFEPIISFVVQIGDFFGNIMPIFTFLFGLIFP